MELLIVDDETLARQRLLRMVEKIEGFCVVSEADNAEDALVAITDKEVAAKILKVLDAIDDLDDVTNVHTNADIQTEE